MDVLRERGYVAQVKDSKNCLIFDKQIYQSGAATGSSTPQMKKFCGPVSVAPITHHFISMLISYAHLMESSIGP